MLCYRASSTLDLELLTSGLDVVGNSASRDGGAMRVEGDNNLTLSNTVLSGR